MESPTNKTENSSGKIHSIKCTYCGKVYKKEQSLVIHERRHIWQKPYRCVICDKMYATCERLSKHQLEHNQDEKFKHTFVLDVEVGSCSKKDLNTHKLEQGQDTMLSHAVPQDVLVQCYSEENDSAVGNNVPEDVTNKVENNNVLANSRREMREKQNNILNNFVSETRNNENTTGNIMNVDIGADVQSEGISNNQKTRIQSKKNKKLTNMKHIEPKIIILKKGGLHQISKSSQGENETICNERSICAENIDLGDVINHDETGRRLGVRESHPENSLINIYEQYDWLKKPGSNYMESTTDENSTTARDLNHENVFLEICSTNQINNNNLTEFYVSPPQSKNIIGKSNVPLVYTNQIHRNESSEKTTNQNSPSVQTNQNQRNFCETASLSPIERDALYEHKKISQNHYDCEICGKSFKFRHHLKGHMRTHAEHKFYTCKFCKNTFFLAVSFKKHLLICKQKNKMKFNIENGDLQESEDLKEVTEAVSKKGKVKHCKKEEKHRCVKCNKMFVKWGNFLKHAIGCKCAVKRLKNRNLECDENRTKVISTEQKTKENRNTKVLALRQIKEECQNCGKKFRRFANFQKHAVVCNTKKSKVSLRNENGGSVPIESARENPSEVSTEKISEVKTSAVDISINKTFSQNKKCERNKRQDIKKIVHSNKKRGNILVGKLRDSLENGGQSLTVYDKNVIGRKSKTVEHCGLSMNPSDNVRYTALSKGKIQHCFVSLSPCEKSNFKSACGGKKSEKKTNSVTPDLLDDIDHQQAIGNNDYHHSSKIMDLDSLVNDKGSNHRNNKPIMADTIVTDKGSYHGNNKLILADTIVTDKGGYHGNNKLILADTIETDKGSNHGNNKQIMADPIVTDKSCNNQNNKLILTDTIVTDKGSNLGNNKPITADHIVINMVSSHSCGFEIDETGQDHNGTQKIVSKSKIKKVHCHGNKIEMIFSNENKSELQPRVKGHTTSKQKEIDDVGISCYHGDGILNENQGKITICDKQIKKKHTNELIRNENLNEEECNKSVRKKNSKERECNEPIRKENTKEEECNEPIRKENTKEEECNKSIRKENTNERENNTKLNEPIIQECTNEEKLNDPIKSQKTYECLACNKTFEHQFSLQLHQNEHLNKRIYCKQCPRSFVLHWRYVNHLKWHVDQSKKKLNKPFKIHYNWKIFKKMAGYKLTSYMSKSGDLMSKSDYLKCNLCGLSFSRRYSLQLHKMKHSGFLPYKCNKCGNKYLRNCHLARHKMSKHKGKAKKKKTKTTKNSPEIGTKTMGTVVKGGTNEKTSLESLQNNVLSKSNKIHRTIESFKRKSKLKQRKQFRSRKKIVMSGLEIAKKLTKDSEKTVGMKEIKREKNILKLKLNKNLKKENLKKFSLDGKTKSVKCGDLLLNTGGAIRLSENFIVQERSNLSEKTKKPTTSGEKLKRQNDIVKKFRSHNPGSSDSITTIVPCSVKVRRRRSIDKRIIDKNDSGEVTTAEVFFNPHNLGKVTTAKVPNDLHDSGEVTTAKVSNDPHDSGEVTTAKVPNNPQDSGEVTTARVPNDLHDSGEVTTAKVPNNPHDSGEVATATVPDDLHDSGEVTTAKVLNDLHDSGEVTTAKVLNDLHDLGEVPTAKVPNDLHDSGEVTTAKVPNDLHDSGEVTTANVPNDLHDSGEVTTKKVLNQHGFEVNILRAIVPNDLHDSEEENDEERNPNNLHDSEVEIEKARNSNKHLSHQEKDIVSSILMCENNYKENNPNEQSLIKKSVEKKNLQKRKKINIESEHIKCSKQNNELNKTSDDDELPELISYVALTQCENELQGQDQCVLQGQGQAKNNSEKLVQGYDNGDKIVPLLEKMKHFDSISSTMSSENQISGDTAFKENFSIEKPSRAENVEMSKILPNIKEPDNSERRHYNLSRAGLVIKYRAKAFATKDNTSMNENVSDQINDMTKRMSRGKLNFIDSVDESDGFHFNGDIWKISRPYEAELNNNDEVDTAEHVDECTNPKGVNSSVDNLTEHFPGNEVGESFIGENTEVMPNIIYGDIVEKFADDHIVKFETKSTLKLPNVPLHNLNSATVMLDRIDVDNTGSYITPGGDHVTAEDLASSKQVTIINFTYTPGQHDTESSGHFKEQHVEEVPKQKQVGSKEESTCLKCGKMYRFGHQLESHMRFHNGRNQHRCQVCGKVFFLKALLKRHLKKHSGALPGLEHTNMSKSAANKKTEKQIMPRDGKTNRMKYKEMKKRFREKAAMTESGNYSEVKETEKGIMGKWCKYCQRTSDALHIKQHEHIQIKTRVHKCDRCLKAFARLSILNRHKKTHLKQDSRRCVRNLRELRTRTVVKQNGERIKENGRQTGTRINMQQNENLTKPPDEHRIFENDSISETRIDRNSNDEKTLSRSEKGELVNQDGVHSRSTDDDFVAVDNNCQSQFNDNILGLEEVENGTNTPKAYRCTRCFKDFKKCGNLINHVSLHLKEMMLKRRKKRVETSTLKHGKKITISISPMKNSLTINSESAMGNDEIGGNHAVLEEDINSVSSERGDNCEESVNTVKTNLSVNLKNWRKVSKFSQENKTEEMQAKKKGQNQRKTTKNDKSEVIPNISLVKGKRPILERNDVKNLKIYRSIKKKARVLSKQEGDCSGASVEEARSQSSGITKLFSKKIGQNQKRGLAALQTNNQGQLGRITDKIFEKKLTLESRSTCYLCGSVFARPWYLKTHIMTHTGEKPHSCDHCQRKFLHLNSLKRHKLIIHRK